MSMIVVDVNARPVKLTGRGTYNDLSLHLVTQKVLTIFNPIYFH